MKYLGGYSILDLTDANVHAQANICYNQDKPVLVYGANGERYFADTITKSGTSIIITKGGKTITIANDNTITNIGDIQPLMENIVDVEGNNRFIEGNIKLLDDTKITLSYGKWSLSGSHLMIVVAGQLIASSSFVDDESLFQTIGLPQFILDKIYPMKSKYVAWQTFTTIDDANWQAINVAMQMRKETNSLVLAKNTSQTITNNTNFRFQFDLLIDTDYSE